MNPTEREIGRALDGTTVRDWGSPYMNGVRPDLIVVDEAHDLRQTFYRIAKQSIERQDEDMAQGLHKNTGKLRLDLIPTEAIESMALVLGKACEPKPGEAVAKYPERNWEKGLDWMAACTSVERHLLDFKKGVDVDPEFGALHLEHAITRLAMLLALVKRGVGKDDRPTLRAPAPEPYSFEEMRFTFRARVNE